MKFINKIILLSLALILMLTSAGCTDYSFKSELTNIPLGAQIDGKYGLPSFLDIYEAWKYDINTVYVQAGIDEYTNTYLLEKMPSTFSTLINSTNEYNMDVYALLDSDMWVEGNKVSLVSQEVINVLAYNKKYRNKRFKGINIGVNLDNVNKNNLEHYYINLKEIRKLINLHNEYGKDTLKLSINVDDNLIDNLEFVDKIIDLVDEIVYVSEVNKDFIKNGEKILSVVDKYGNKKVDIMIDFDNIIINKNLINLIKDLDENLIKFNKYKSFKGLIINDYEKYISIMKKKDHKLLAYGLSINYMLI